MFGFVNLSFYRTQKRVKRLPPEEEITEGHGRACHATAFDTLLAHE
jgi:hypothetical protein